MPTFTADEVGAIVADAARHQHREDESFTEDEVIAIASEFGVDAEHVRSAMERRTRASADETRRARELQSFRTHATVYAIVIGSMWAVGIIGAVVAISTGVWGAVPFWMVFPTLGWGIGLWSHWNKVQRIGTERESRQNSHHRHSRHRSRHCAPHS